MIKRFLPSREGIRQSRLLRMLGPRIQDPLLWQVNRNSVARGAAIGIFFGLLLPFFQIPPSAVAAILLRANLWIAALCTLVTNPLTYGPLYILGYRIGSRILPPTIATHPPEVEVDVAITALQWLIETVNWLTGIGRPLVLGMMILAVTGACLAYFGVLLCWRINVLLKRRRQRLQRSTERRATPAP